jgi:hypothetical protein
MPAVMTANPPNRGLANTQGNKIVDEASTEDPIAACSKTGESSTGDGLDGRAGQNILVVCNTQVVEEIENTNTGKGLSIDVCKDGRKTLGVHGTKLGEDEVELGEGVDDDENVRELEILAVPRKGPLDFELALYCITEGEVKLTVPIQILPRT